MKKLIIIGILLLSILLYGCKKDAITTPTYCSTCTTYPFGGYPSHPSGTQYFCGPANMCDKFESDCEQTYLTRCIRKKQ